ncbi:hypothetical protein ACER0C_017770 [Sarotherodon galilaeus]
MESSGLEDLKLEVAGTLYTVTRDILIEVCDFLNIAGSKLEKVSGKSLSSLISYIIQHLEGEELGELEDEGMSELLILKYKIFQLQQATQNSTSGHKTSDANQTDEVQEQEIETLQLALALSRQNKTKQPSGAKLTMGVGDNSAKQTTPPFLTLPWGREFKISGQIGEPGQKDKLTFSSLAHQIEQGISKGVPEVEIVDAVIRAIAPGLQLRSYLEGKTNLTLPTLRRILRSHYQERGATELYKQLTSEVQSIKETPQTFLIRALDLRQKNLLASQEAESGLRYDPVLVQSMFLHTVLTGLQNDNIKSDLQPYLQETITSDELLLEKLNVACANEAERQNKKKLLSQQWPATVHSLQSDTPADKKGKNPKPESISKAQPDLLNELKEICSDMALLKNLGAEVAQIKEIIQQPCPAQTQYSASPAAPECVPSSHLEHLPQNYWPPVGPGQRGDTAQYQQRFAPQCQYPAVNRACLRKGFGCQQSGTEYCNHCYQCGSGEHFLAGCRVKLTNQQ